ncbi:hypothetical protein QVD17_42017 [Tagetes erecta]|uniref:DUF223 domain-containing protein n=1 Tax=Tagetes erecta TaxID=13708 RepID=A0AAD8JMY5_TARER|nr:hypothetical protein QVD17_42017 [Tagetes erecta]
MEHNNITLIKNVDLSNADLTMKLRIVRLWKLPDHINKKEVYSIEMILVDEEPNFGSVRSLYQYVDNNNKVVFVSSTKVERCNVFNGPQHGFSFTSLKAINEHSVSEDLSIDVIGEVQDLQPIKTFLNGEGNLTKQATFKIRDSEGQVMSVTLFAEYAEQFIEYLQKHPEEVRLIVILQFGRIKWFQDDELFIKTEFINIEELSEIKEKPKKLLKIFAKDLIGGSQSRDYIGGSHSKDVMQSNQQVSDFLDYPPLLNTLLHRKFAFKIEISSFVLDHNLSVYGINKLSADDGIISQLNQKVDTQDVVSVTDDNVTPASNTEKSTATSPLVRAKNSEVSSTTSHLKRNLSEAYDFDPLTANLSTKLPRGYVLTDPSDAIKLLEPKMEK